MATENLQPQIISRILKEVRQLVKSPPDGIVYMENENSTVSEIFATITGPDDTPFTGGKFLVKLVLSEDYPSSPPKGYFITRIYHPNVSNHGDICVNTLKRDWNADVTLVHVLQVIRCLLIVPFPESSLNDEAGKLFMESYEEYAKRARVMTQVHASDAEECRKESREREREREREGAETIEGGLRERERGRGREPLAG
eukprot:CAMPEP_0182428264 /NCGR_PEP_ID=MMETSP1167-20130531/21828_1 /TAXON_ID=2988 /ORGANISM="Mallomonas Sp, Strain CCMP3275" /LENGTH=198 /DNA_ID=CAMNT_0024611041 /DNA_START=152 /DNA_END=745 /DNA_ORIENTATION=-